MSNTTTHGTAVWLPGPKVRERYQRSDMTIHRWLNDPDLDFPRPTYFGRNRYWRLEELEDWEEQQARKGSGRYARAPEIEDAAEGGEAA